MGFLDRLRKAPLPPPDPATPQPAGQSLPAPDDAVGDEIPTLPDGGWVNTVGESFYRDSFLTLFGRLAEYGFFTDVIAELVPEPDNPHDPAAVGILIAGRKVAHLSRDDARSFRFAIDEAIALHGKATARGEVRSNGPDPSNPAREFSVVLRFSDRPTTLPDPEPDEVRLAVGGSVSVSNEEHYQTALLTATESRDVSSYGYPVLADLVIAEDGNPWIKKPTGPLLSVRIGADVVGFLTRAMSERFAPFVTFANDHGKRLTAGAWLQRGVRGGTSIVEITLNAVPRRYDQDTIESLDVAVTPELVVHDGTVHRLTGQRPDGSWEAACGVQVRAAPENLIGTTKPWVGRVEIASGRIYDDRLPCCERC